jgi:hypothetical protein
MKIYDIISEPDTIESFLEDLDNTLAKKGIITEAPNFATQAIPGSASGLVMPAGATTATPTPTAPNPNAPAQSSRTVKRARIAAKKAGRTASKVSASKMSTALKGKIANELTLLDLYGKKVEKFIPKTAFKFMVVIKWLGMLPFFYEYWQDKTAISSLASKNEISADDASAAQRIAVTELVTKIVVSAGFANLLKWLLRLRYLRYAAIAGGAVASVATLGLFGGPAVVAILATEAAAIWLQTFLQSEKGKEIVAYCVVYAIDPALTWVWNKGPGAWSEALKAPELSAAGANKVIAATKADGKAPAKVAAAAAAPGANQAANPAIDATSTEPEDPTLAATKATIGDLLKPGDKKWGTGNAGFPKAGGGNVDPSEYKSKAPK